MTLSLSFRLTRRLWECRSNPPPSGVELLRRLPTSPLGRSLSRPTLRVEVEDGGVYLVMTQVTGPDQVR